MTAYGSKSPSPTHGTASANMRCTRGPATNNKQGIGWYRLQYDAKPMAKGRRMYIDFAAVGNIADVWVNGAHVGQHKGAFTRFRFDVSREWKPGARNLIVVRADNSKPAVGSATEHVIPLAGDFFIHGGLYRGVQLIEANDVGIDLLDFGGPGVYVRSNWDLNAEIPLHAPCVVSTRVDVTVRVRNSGSQSRQIQSRLPIQIGCNREIGRWQKSKRKVKCSTRQDCDIY